jgi:hypothetical protein
MELLGLSGDRYASRCNNELDKGGNLKGSNRGREHPGTKTLASQGIDKNLAKRARKLAEIKKAEFEVKMTELKDKVLRHAHKIIIVMN